jgi:putative nucleotidyltransferase with HDIG domain
MVISDTDSKLAALSGMLAPQLSVTTALIDRVPKNHKMRKVLIAADLSIADNIGALKQSFARVKSSNKRIFVMENKIRLFAMQAYALGATDLIFSPVVRESLLGKLIDPAPGVLVPAPRLEGARGAAAGAAEEMALMFSAVLGGRQIDVAAANLAADRIADSVADEGLTTWLDTVRLHHEGTYQHCLLVTGVAIDFGLTLGLAKMDIQRLYSAAMFHDIGKASISAAILDKPGKLDPDERTLIETHPVVGHDYLKRSGGISSEVLDAVRHHHEMLDGSGYPDRLSGRDISDIVRILTISDIFAALIEDRRYKAPIPRDQAYDILLGMCGKLEAPLVRAFKHVALER